MNSQSLLKDYKVFIDTCSWMYPPANEYIEREMISNENVQENLIVPRRVMDEVNKHLDSDEEDRKKRARLAADLLNTAVSDKGVRVFGDEADPFADQTFLYVFQRFRQKYNLALITQDRALADDIDKLNNQNSVKSNKNILVLRVNKHGQLHKWGDAPVPSQRRKTPEPTNKIPLGTKLEQTQDEVLDVKNVPANGDSVVSEKYGLIQLGEEVGSGGEGMIYKTDLSYVCKIYRPRNLTTSKQRKLEWMTTIDVEMEGICWPADLVRNHEGEFVGYIMPKAKGKPMQSTMMRKPVLKKNFPHWTRKELVQLSVTILEKIEYLHQRNIIIGDINPLNILVKSEKEIYFVDTDSYQIGNLPCPVGTVNFTAPEIQGKNYGSFLRTFEHEYFAVATLLFMTLLPGKSPFAQQGGTTAYENIKQSEFPYPLGDDSTGKAPDGPWRYIWSHLPFKTKSAFYKTFKEGERVSPSDWLDILDHYLYLFSKGYTTTELFPQGHKIPDGEAVEMVCIDCSAVHQVHKRMKEDLLQKGLGSRCVACREKHKMMKVINTVKQADQGRSTRSTTSTSSNRRQTSSNQVNRTRTNQTIQANQWRHRNHNGPTKKVPNPPPQKQGLIKTFLNRIFS